MLCPTIPPMLSKAITVLPPAAAFDGQLAAEPKFDGFRALLFRNPDGGVEIQSRAGKLLTAAFPEIVRLVRNHLPGGVVLDGELIIWHQKRLSFPLLQRRLVGGTRTVLARALEHPAHFVAFDVLHLPGNGDVRRRPLHERRLLLEALLDGAHPQLALCPQTTSLQRAREWLDTWPAVGVEGLVFKPLNDPYRGGNRSSWTKLRDKTSTEAIVGGVTGTLSRPDTLLLGRRDGITERIRYVGRTLPLGDAQRAGLRGVLRLLGAGRQNSVAPPWPVPLPANWLGQFRQPVQPLRYLPVEPDLVAEIEVDTAYEPVLVGNPPKPISARFRHPPKFLRIRTDMSIFDVPLAAPDL